MTFRNRKFLDLAHRINECQIGIPEVCRGYTVEGCEPAHPNWSSWSNKGMGHKAHDMFAASCHECAVTIDQGNVLSKKDREWYWFRGFYRTQVIIFSQGWVQLV